MRDRTNDVQEDLQNRPNIFRSGVVTTFCGIIIRPFFLENLTFRTGQYGMSVIQLAR